jgi:hypothetical protein
MIFRNPRKRLATAIFALAFGIAATGEPGAAEPDSAKVAVVAFGMFGDQSVFASEAKGAAEIAAGRFGGDPVIVRHNSRDGGDATVDQLATALDAAAHDLDAEHDMLMVILTSHGSRTGLAVRAAGHDDMLWPQILAAMLDHAGVRHRVVIISACYAGVFIPLLANPDTLVITAADADHSSFGCLDGAEWTYFGDAFFNVALRGAANLTDAFALARRLVRERELKSGFEPSNPQMAGGENLEPRIRGSLDPGAAPTWSGAAVRPWPGEPEAGR